MTPSLNMPGPLLRMASRWSSVFFLFLKSREHFSGTRFSSNSNEETAVENCLNGQGLHFYQAVLNKLFLRSDKGLNRFGDYVEK
ncbi:hypothetical protein AVEN_258517-1 [Araneus ventricosus]|uniref:Uncharacterized protein n=1 Tax=Araneus ventricosus TaxID=182803 RepID=A0A4Y2X8D6_ARAVE|nr:hypothetical protein AVEN_258517-1 [Araneus ventricosus]